MFNLWEPEVSHHSVDEGLDAQQLANNFKILCE